MEAGSGSAKIEARDVDFYYGRKQVLFGISLDILPQAITALIGPSGCGKSTFLRVLNRMNDLIPGTRLAGNVRIDDEDIYRNGYDVVTLRRKVGMVFQKPNPFPKSIFDNVAYGPRIHGIRNKDQLQEIVEDTGIGIPAEELPRVTERFFQGERKTQDREMGSGLGLAIVKHLVKLMRGQLSIQSQESRGTTVKVILPVAPDEEEALDG